jgi:hypothetical protein
VKGVFMYALMRLWAIGETAPEMPPVADQPATPEVTPTPASTPGWVAQLPSDLKADESFTKFSTLGDFAKDYKETRGKLVELDGRVSKMIPRLPEKPTPEDLTAFRGAMGIPETPDKYDLKRVEWPAAMGQYPEQVETSFKEFAHQHNMTPDQVQASYDWYMGNVLNAGADMEKVAERRKADCVAELQKAWGDDYVAKSEEATRAFWFYADPEDVAFFENSGLGDNPRFIRMFHRIFLQTANDRMTRDARPPTPRGEGPKMDAYGKPRLSYPSMEQGK